MKNKISLSYLKGFLLLHQFNFILYTVNMAFQILFLLPFFWSIATASFNSDVYHALTILNELPADLAEPFCQNYDGGYAPTTTLTETWAPVTSTTTAAPTQCGPWLSTVTGTTTITFTTYALPS
jgi:hypothetical protein